MTCEPRPHLRGIEKQEQNYARLQRPRPEAMQEFKLERAQTGRDEPGNHTSTDKVNNGTILAMYILWMERGHMEA